MKEEQLVDSAVFLCDVGFLINHHCCVACLTGKVSREKVQKKNNVNMIAKLFDLNYAIYKQNELRGIYIHLDSLKGFTQKQTLNFNFLC